MRPPPAGGQVGVTSLRQPTKCPRAQRGVGPRASAHKAPYASSEPSTGRDRGPSDGRSEEGPAEGPWRGSCRRAACPVPRSEAKGHGPTTRRLAAGRDPPSWRRLTSSASGAHPSTASAPEPRAACARCRPFGTGRVRSPPAVSSLRIMTSLCKLALGDAPTLGLRLDLTMLCQLGLGPSGASVPPMNPSLRPGRTE